MKDILTHASNPYCPVLSADISRSRYGLTALRCKIAAWRERTRFRWALRQMVRDNPHLLDDIGLSKTEAEKEIARLPFWQR